MLEPILHARRIDRLKDKSFDHRSSTGLGAFEVWTMAEGIFESIRGKPFSDIPEVMENFSNALIESNVTALALYSETGGSRENIERLQEGVETWLNETEASDLSDDNNGAE